MARFEDEKKFVNELKELLNTFRLPAAQPLEDAELKNLITCLEDNKLVFSAEYLELFEQLCYQYNIYSKTFYENIFITLDKDAKELLVKDERRSTPIQAISNYSESLPLPVEVFKSFCHLIKMYPQIEDVNKSQETIHTIISIYKKFITTKVFYDLAEDKKIELIALFLNSLGVSGLEVSLPLSSILDTYMTKNEIQQNFLNNEYFCHSIVIYLNKTKVHDEYAYINKLPALHFKSFYMKHIQENPLVYSQSGIKKHMDELIGLDYADPTSKKTLSVTKTEPVTFNTKLLAKLFFGIQAERDRFKEGGDDYYKTNQSIMKDFLFNVFLKLLEQQNASHKFRSTIQVKGFLNGISEKIEYNGSTDQAIKVDADNTVASIKNSKFFQQIMKDVTLIKLSDADKKHKASLLAKIGRQYTAIDKTAKASLMIGLPTLLSAIATTIIRFVYNNPSAARVKLAMKCLWAISAILISVGGLGKKANDGVYAVHTAKNNHFTRLVAERFLELAHSELARPV